MLFEGAFDRNVEFRSSKQIGPGDDKPIGALDLELIDAVITDGPD